ncbi:MAG: hypothetical protein GX348_06355, partial [Veillonellaceae bacterium]|nr:hypothetical protein [Veillonellaceae bacterium]
MNDYCLESAHQRIYNTITKNQFSEVIKSYNSQNYRSATVMLWSVVVCDLVYKLQELETVYKDPGAASILEYIKSEQESKPTSSEWEMEIFKRANKSTGLISLKLQADLEYMQKNRHCCAHPVMTSEYKLYTPSKDLVRSFIRLALEELLTKSPIMHTKSFNSFLADANSIYPQMEYEQKRYFRYLDNKYFSRLDRVGIQYYFKTLWKFVFTLENEQCDLHRYNNYLILLHLFAENRELLTTIIQEEQHHFSNISNNDPIKKLLVDFLSKHTHVFKLLNDTAKVQIETCSNTYASCL